MRRKPTLPLVLASVLLAQYGLAQTGSGEQNQNDSDRDGGFETRFEITPFVGPRTHGAFRSGDPNNNRIVEVDDSVSLGAFFDFPVTETIFLEGLYTRQSSQVLQGESPSQPEAPTTPFVEAGEPLFDLSIDYLHGGVVYTGASDRFSGYAGIAGGLARLNPDVPEASTVNKFSFSLALGFRSFVTERVGVRFDARAFGLRAGEDEEVLTPGGVFDPVSFNRASTFWQTHFVVGVVIRL